MAAGDRGQPLQQERADAPAVPALSDRHRQFGPALGRPLVGGDGQQPTAELGHEYRVVAVPRVSPIISGSTTLVPELKNRRYRLSGDMPVGVLRPTRPETYYRPSALSASTPASPTANLLSAP